MWSEGKKSKDKSKVECLAYLRGVGASLLAKLVLLDGDLPPSENLSSNRTLN